MRERDEARAALLRWHGPIDPEVQKSIRSAMRSEAARGVIDRRLEQMKGPRAAAETLKRLLSG